MIEAYKKILEMESVAELKLEQDRKALNKLRRILFQEKDFILNKLIVYLKNELNINYRKYVVVDLDNNVSDILVKEDSKIFKEEIEDKEYLNFDVEELIDKRIFDNEDEIIIVDINSNEKLLNLSYICDSLNYNYLSYADKLKEKLTVFVNYVLNKNI